jgi:hypothetical protein
MLSFHDGSAVALRLRGSPAPLFIKSRFLPGAMISAGQEGKIRFT